MTIESKQIRYHLIDTIRGITIISMILYHGAWDLIYIYHANIPLYHSKLGYVWQQSICWTFILIAGFCWSLSKKTLKHGLLVFTIGALISLITCTLMPENRILYGVLTMLGSSMLLMIPLNPLLRKICPSIGLIACFVLFLCTKTINSGNLRLASISLFTVPDRLYHGHLSTYLGFTDPTFYSSDYFSIFPWFFLFCCGYFIYHIMKENNLFSTLLTKQIKPLSFVGKHALFIYALHQPVIYGLLFVVFSLLID